MMSDDLESTWKHIGSANLKSTEQITLPALQIIQV